uniref:Uncharacterized protein n=1 Tax=viral metagenome TaxID=1070528 RepID=A0A6M3KW17_9ZZZZ
MDGLKFLRTNIILFLGRLPGRKQECFYFEEDGVIYPIAYISSRNLKEAQRLWTKLLEGELK